MATVARKFRIVLVVLSFYLAAIELQFACMNIEFAPVFRTFNVPDRPVTGYVEGNLGIVEPRYFHTYLFWAYRHLAGVGISQPEREALLPWEYRPPPTSPAEFVEPVTAWDKARRQINPAAPPRDHVEYGPQYRRAHDTDWIFFLNCPEDSFKTATNTLENRIQRFGARSREVKEWLDGQDTVFSNCAGGAAIPGPIPAGLDPLIGKDREYQIAAAHFYSGQYDEAARRFEAIGRDPNSPWREWGAYLAARCFIRKGTLGAEVDQPDRPNLAEARRRLQAVLDDPRLSRVHDSVRGLLDYVMLRLDSEQQMTALSARLLGRQPAADLNHNWTDYDWLLDRGIRPKELDELTDWITAFRDESPDAATRALRKWRRSNTLPWLLAVLAKIAADHEAAKEIVQAAAAVKPESPGFVMASFHRFRLLAAMGREDEARTGLDAILWENEVPMPPSARNHMLALRQNLASDFDTFLRAAPRQWVGGFWDKDNNMPLILDADSLIALNERLPLSRLNESARSDRLNRPIRKEIALAAWARAAIIEDPIEAELRPLVREHWPALDADLEAYGRVTDADARRFNLAFLVLRNPGIRPYVGVTTKRADPIEETNRLRENWWCLFDEGTPMHTANYLKRTGLDPEDSGLFPSRPRTAPGDLSFLTAAEKSDAKGQLARLNKIPAAPSYLGDVVVSFARTHADDPRMPEALHRVVLATRVGCTDDQNTRFSRAAFQLLHRNYPRSEWAAKTKYWY